MSPSSVLGPWTPSTRFSSMSEVAEGPLIHVIGRVEEPYSRPVLAGRMSARGGLAMAETFTGEVRNGVVVFEGEATAPPEGARVRVELIETSPPGATMADRLRSVIGRAKGLPADMAEQHDHDLHGPRPVRPS